MHNLLESSEILAHSAVEQQAKVAEEAAEYLSKPPKEFAKKIKQMEQRMHQHAQDLEFEQAAAIRDKIQHVLREPFCAAECCVIIEI